MLKEKIYEWIQLFCSQLFYDGYQQVAASMINVIHPDTACPPSDRLMKLVTMGLEVEQKGNHIRLHCVSNNYIRKPDIIYDRTLF